mmetsp:Transcript_8945/g.7987  ORF Transcript_8945/g.7987 Transcript_8945/m.7987 type:complete len:124 (-) Transcript_8945:21-392(-)
MSNAPERYLTWRGEEELLDHERLTYQPDSKKPNTGTFILSKEDHTIGNLLRVQLLRNPSVKFAAYRMIHPLVFDCHVRVETMDSKVTPIDTFESALSDLQLETEILERQFEMALGTFNARQGL